MISKFYFFARQAVGTNPAGVTVSKYPSLPAGDFRITEFIWPERSLWFVDDDNFTADEREAARWSNAAEHTMDAILRTTEAAQ